MNTKATSQRFPGVWLSQYTYHSTSQNADVQSGHYVRLYEDGNSLVVESLPNEKGGYLVMRMSRSLDDAIVTGSWEEHTMPDGAYSGAVYHGAIQMAIAAGQKSMEGKWVGFGKRMDIKTGPWSLRYVAADDSDLSPLA